MTSAFLRGRRRFFARTLGAAGALLLAGCNRLSQSDWFPKVLGAGETASAAAAALVGHAQVDGAGVHDGRPFAEVSQQRHGGSERSAVPGAGRARLRRLSARSRRPGRDAGVVLARGAPRAAVAHADHASRLCRGLERDRAVEGREALGTARRGAPEAGGALRRVPLRRSDGAPAGATRITRASTWTMPGTSRPSSPTS